MIEEAYEKLKEGYFEDAVESFSTCLQRDPHQARIYYGRGMARFKLEKWESALEDFCKAKELNPDDPENWMACAMTCAMDNKIYEAIDLFEQLLANYPRYIRGHVQCAQLYYRLGVIPKGHAQLDIALASRPSLSERRMIEQLKNEQLALDKKRYYRPDFGSLRQQNQTVPFGLLKRLKNLLRKKGASR